MVPECAESHTVRVMVHVLQGVVGEHSLETSAPDDPFPHCSSGIGMVGPVAALRLWRIVAGR